GDGQERQALTELIRERALEDRVRLIGAVDEGVIRGELERSHLFALASHAEPLGVAIMEAMAMEIPVVVTAAGGVPELVRDGEDGVLVPPRDPKALARAIENLAADPVGALHMGRMGAQRVRQKFNSEVSAAAIAERLGTGAAPQAIQGVP